MFFTLIISAYNCEKTINRLLDSVVKQHEPDLKVIVIDDSDHKGLYEDFIKNYEKELNIEYYPRRNELYKYHCPSNTRHDGLQRALEENTEYILFADDDDEFIPDKLSIIKKIIKEQNYPNELFTPFYEWNEITGEQVQLHIDRAWLHGNFYKKTFIKKYNIQFQIDLISQEDVYFNSLVGCYLIAEQSDLILFEDVIYKWYYRDDSNSHYSVSIAENENQPIETYFKDYLEAAINPNIIVKKQFPEMTIKYCYQAIFGLIAGYFYYQGSVFNKNNKICKINYEIFKEMLIKVMKNFKITSEKIIEIAYEENDTFNYIREDCKKSIGNYVEDKSFKDFIYSFNL